MENVVLTNLSIPEIRQLFRQELETYFKANKQPEQPPTEQPERFLTIREAAEFLKLSPATIYGKVHRNELPYMKRGKKVYFSSRELLDYMKAGRVKTNTEIAGEAEKLLSNK